jgi:hypothetical protein
MLDSFPYSAIVTSLALLVYVWVSLKVGGARAKFGVKAPNIDGPPDFQRVFRVQQNTLEQLALFVPALWLFAAAWGDMAAAIVGIGDFAAGRARWRCHESPLAPDSLRQTEKGRGYARDQQKWSRFCVRSRAHQYSDHVPTGKPVATFPGRGLAAPFFI